MDYLPEEGKGQFECLVIIIIIIIIIILGVFGYQLVEVYVGGGQVSLMWSLLIKIFVQADPITWADRIFHKS